MIINIYLSSNSITNKSKSGPAFLQYSVIEAIKQTQHIVTVHILDEKYGRACNTDRKVPLKVNPDITQWIHCCDLVIENMTTGKYFILSLADLFCGDQLDNLDRPELENVFMGQYIPEVVGMLGKKYSYKIKPWTYVPSSTVDREKFYNYRRFLSNNVNYNLIKNKLFWLGTNGSRPIIYDIDPNLIKNTYPLQQEDYYQLLVKHRVALAVGGASYSDMCYRDIEYLQLGVPYIKFEYKNTMNPPLIPNYHYISIPVPDDLPIHNSVMSDRLGLPHHAELIKQRFHEVVNDMEFLKYISINARQYYLDNLTLDKQLQRTLQLLDL
tara:strand:+ start:747 stop:1721 length:975 start_codon:yes stop_codon:yes gene_type:complete